MKRAVKYLFLSQFLFVETEGHKEMSSILADQQRPQMSPNAGGMLGGGCRFSDNEYSCAHREQINIWRSKSIFIHAQRGGKPALRSGVLACERCGAQVTNCATSLVLQLGLVFLYCIFCAYISCARKAPFSNWHFHIYSISDGSILTCGVTNWYIQLVQRECRTRGVRIRIDIDGWGRAQEDTFKNHAHGPNQ